MTTFSYSTAATGTVPADVLVLPVFEGPEPGPGLSDVKGVDLLARYRDAKLTVYAPDRTTHFEPVGHSCRTCPRRNCLHRVIDPLAG